MAFCIYCGKQVEDDSDFCPYCGKKQNIRSETNSGSPQEAEMYREQTSYAELQPNSRKKSKSAGATKTKTPVIAIIIIIVAAAAFAAGFFFIRNGGFGVFGGNSESDAQALVSEELEENPTEEEDAAEVEETESSDENALSVEAESEQTESVEATENSSEAQDIQIVSSAATKLDLTLEQEVMITVTGASEGEMITCVSEDPGIIEVSPAEATVSSDGNVFTFLPGVQGVSEGETAKSTTVTISVGGESITYTVTNSHKVEEINPGTIEVTSDSIYSDENGSFEPGILVDGKRGTSWCAGDKYGDNEWADFTFSKSRKLRKISIYNGYTGYSDDGNSLYDSYCRAKEVKFTFYHFDEVVDEITVQLQDTSLEQEFYLDEVTMTSRMRMTVLSVYEGSDPSKGTCIDEVNIYK